MEYKRFMSKLPIPGKDIIEGALTPSSYHSRFTHTLEVISISDRLVEALMNKVQHLPMGHASEAIRQAALVHDLAHPRYFSFLNSGQYCEIPRPRDVGQIGIDQAVLDAVLNPRQYFDIDLPTVETAAFIQGALATFDLTKPVPKELVLEKRLGSLKVSAIQRRERPGNWQEIMDIDPWRLLEEQFSKLAEEKPQEEHVDLLQEILDFSKKVKRIIDRMLEAPSRRLQRLLAHLARLILMLFTLCRHIRRIQLAPTRLFTLCYQTEFGNA